MIRFSDEKVSIGAKSPVMGRRKSMGGFFFELRCSFKIARKNIQFTYLKRFHC